VTQPLEGKNVLTLQTCTLPDYSQRLIVQAERVDGPDPPIAQGDSS
jgi:sortase A